MENNRYTKRYFVLDINQIELSTPIRYERCYISNEIRVQRKDSNYTKQVIKNNIIVSTTPITKEEFLKYQKQSQKTIIRDSYLYLKDNKVSVKRYYGEYEGLIRAEVKFDQEEQMEQYRKESWMTIEITNTKLAFDSLLYTLNRKQFLTIQKQIKEKIAWED